MGATNVNKVFKYWNHLNHREVRALVFMANISMDDHQPPIYFRGWEALAVALGADPHGDPESARRTAIRALGALCKAGAIVSSGQARMGIRAEYALTLDPDVKFEPAGNGRNVVWKRLEPETATVTQPETATVTQPETDSVPKVRQLGVPLGTTPGTTGGRGGGAISPEYVTTSTREAKKRKEDGNLPDEPLTEDQERQRQMKALQELMKAAQ